MPLSFPISPSARAALDEEKAARTLAEARELSGGPVTLVSEWLRPAPAEQEELQGKADAGVARGFVQLYVDQNATFFARAGGTFIGAVLLWDTLFRGQLGFSVSFLEEMWARNMGNLMISPLRPSEFVSALMVMSIVRLAIGMVPVTLLAIAFFGFNVWSLGLALPPLAQIDHVLVGPSMAAVGMHTVDLPGSDHRGVVAEVARR